MNRVALVGFAPSRSQAPFLDAAVEIWTLNQNYRFVPRFDRLFELHDNVLLDQEIRIEKRGDPDYLEWLRTCPVPVYMLQVDPAIPMSRPYPLARVQAGLPSTRRRYFTSTVAYMFALAVSEGFDEIGLYGIDMAIDEEYADQRPNLEYFIGRAEERGIRVIIPESSALLKSDHLYGYEPSPRNRGPFSEVRLATRVTQLDERRAQMVSAYCQIGGAVIELGRLLDTFIVGDPVTRDVIEVRIQTLAVKYEQGAKELAAINGALQEAQNTLSIARYARRGAMPPVARTEEDHDGPNADDDRRDARTSHPPDDCAREGCDDRFRERHHIDVGDRVGACSHIERTRTLSSSGCVVTGKLPRHDSISV